MKVLGLGPVESELSFHTFNKTLKHFGREFPFQDCIQILTASLRMSAATLGAPPGDWPFK